MTRTQTLFRPCQTEHLCIVCVSTASPLSPSLATTEPALQHGGTLPKHLAPAPPNAPRCPLDSLYLTCPFLHQASALFILDSRGKTLISRNFRGDVQMDVISEFKRSVIDAEDVSLFPPRR